MALDTSHSRAVSPSRSRSATCSALLTFSSVIRSLVWDAPRAGNPSTTGARPEPSFGHRVHCPRSVPVKVARVTYAHHGRSHSGPIHQPGTTVHFLTAAGAFPGPSFRFF